MIHDFALGGTERIAIRLANSWAAMGVAVDLFSGSPAGPLRALVHPAVKVTQAGTVIDRRRGSLRRLGDAARVHFTAQRVDAIYIPGNFHWPLVRALRQIPTGIRPKILAQVSAALEKPQRGRFRQWTFELRMRQKLRGADHVIGMCWSAARQAENILRRSDVTAISLPALEDVCAPLHPLPDPATPVIFAAARLVPGKGISALVEAFAALAHPTARLVIAGAGSEQGRISGQIAALALTERVELLGYVPCIRPWLDRANFLVMPSEHEGYGAVIVEALAAGRPVLATDCSPAVKELLDRPDCGLVVPIDDPAALVAGLAEMLARQPVDPALLATQVERFRIGPVARRYLNLVGIAAAFGGAPARLLLPANDAGPQAKHCTGASAAL